MANVYEIIKDFYGVAQNQPLGFTPDKIDMNAYWVLCVLPFAEEVTFQRQSMKSYDADPSQAVKTDGDPLIITSDCLAMQVNTSKDSFMGSLQATLFGTDTNYLARIFPGDWCLAWMLQSEDQAKNLIQRIKNMDVDKPCNNFMDGFKFVGRVRSFRKQLTQAPGGLRTLSYSLQASSFMEFEANVFFDPDLSDQSANALGPYFGALNTQVTNFIGQDGQGIGSQAAFPFLLTLLLGKGFPPALTQPTDDAAGGSPISVGLSAQDPGTPEEEAPYAYLVPEEVGALLGLTSKSKTSGILSAADLDFCLIGVQKYTQHASANFKMFLPDSLTADAQNANHIYCRDKLLGVFLPDFPNFTGEKNVWSILSQYLNPAVNEMYTALRPNLSGAIVPTLVVRQFPFSTDILAAALGGIPPPAGQVGPPAPSQTNQYINNSDLVVTRALELPRWHLHPIMVISADIGRSDSVRFNFVHVYGMPNQTDAQALMTWQITHNPPIQDLADIKRSGLRAHMETVPCAAEDINQNYGAAKWMAIKADILMGMHLTLNGTINCYGIQAPIAVGDALEFDGVVFHIESVLHTVQIEGINRSFYTTLTISHGVRSDDPELPALQVNFQDQTIFPSQSSIGSGGEQTTYDPGITADLQTSEQDPPDLFLQANNTGIDDVE